MGRVRMSGWRRSSGGASVSPAGAINPSPDPRAEFWDASGEFWDVSCGRAGSYSRASKRPTVALPIPNIRAICRNATPWRRSWQTSAGEAEQRGRPTRRLVFGFSVIGFWIRVPVRGLDLAELGAVIVVSMTAIFRRSRYLRAGRDLILLCVLVINQLAPSFVF